MRSPRRASAFGWALATFGACAVMGALLILGDDPREAGIGRPEPAQSVPVRDPGLPLIGIDLPSVAPFGSTVDLAPPGAGAATADPGPAASAADVSLRVVDRAGAGIVGALVSFEGAEVVPEPDRQKTDAQGSWRGELIPQTEEGRFSLQVAAPGFVERRIAFPFFPPGRLELGVIVLDVSAVLRGTVVTAEGRAVPDAIVTGVWLARGITGKRIRAFESDAITDAHGSFALPLGALMEGYSLRIAAWQERLGGPAELELEAPRDRLDDPITLRMPPSSPVAGVVIDEAGIPVDGAVVSLSAEPWSTAGAKLATTTTDAHGRFALAAREGIELSLGASKPGFLEDGERVLPDRSPRDGIVLKLTRACSLEVHARDAVTGEPLERFVVAFCSVLDGHSRCHEGLGQEGVMSLGGLPGGDWGLVTVRADDYDDWTFRVVIQEPGQHIGPVAVFPRPRERSAALDVEVIASYGADVPEGLVVEVRRAVAHNQSVLVASSPVAADGWSRLVDLSAGERWVCVTSADGWRAEPRWVTLTSDARESVRLSAEPPSRILGRVLDERGHPLRDVLLTLDPVPEDSPRLARPTRRSRTDPSGTFAFDGVPFGRYALRTWWRDDSGRERTLEAPPIIGLTLAGGEQRELVIRMFPRVAVRGQVVRARGSAAGLTVRVSANEAVAPGADWAPNIVRGFTTRTGSDGRFEFPSLPAGRQRIEVTDETGARLHAEVVVIKPPEVPELILRMD